MPNPQRLLATLIQAEQAFRTTPERAGFVVRLPADAEVFVAGDMHGNLDNFRQVLQAADLGQNPHRHLVLQELVHGPFRYAGGEDKSHQLLDLVAALKCQYPERVHYLLGNHELAQWQNHRIGKGDVDQNEIFIEGVRAAYGADADAIYAAYLKLFAAANLAIVAANRVLLCHSFPNAKELESFDWALLQSETVPPEAFALHGSVHSLVWGRDLRPENARAFLQKVDADWLITGHIPCDQGFLVPSEYQIILDALGTPAAYCLFPTDRPLTQQELLGMVRIF